MRPTLLAAACLLAAAPGLAAETCAGVDTALTAARKAAYAPLVAQSFDAEVKPAEVEIVDFLREGDWIVVGAVVPVADGEGFLFYRKAGDKLRFLDVWGGWADPSEAGEVAAWARKLGAPAALARCFAGRAVSG